MRKGSKQLEETRAKISESRKGKLLGDSNPSKRLDVRLKLSLAKKGKPLSDEHCQALSNAQIRSQTGRNGNAWKGDKVQYRALHNWIERCLGKPHNCEECGKKDLSHRQYHWSNISGDYKRLTTDWRRLCASCHKTSHRAKTELIFA
jgi:hypothetical protein